MCMGYDPLAPIFTTAKFRSKCAETGKMIEIGDDMLYFPKLKLVYHKTSDEFQGWAVKDRREHLMLPEVKKEYEAEIKAMMNGKY